MFKVIQENQKNSSARFVIEPLEAGFGHTLGNSLRRILLTALEGAAVTAVKIDGISHQFSTIEGITEDVIEIILNIKKIRIRKFGEEPVKLSLKTTGKKKVCAADFEIIGNGEIANPNQHIATLNSPKAKLNMELVVEKGRGYSSAEERKIDEIGVISTDAIFSPVLSVDYKVEATRVGRRTNFDKLIMEITTDGTIEPKNALEEAAKILSTTFKQIYEPDRQEEQDQPSVKAVSDEVLKMTVDELDLPVRITNALRAIDIETVENLINISRSHLLKAKNLGSKSLTLISEKLNERGLSLGET